MEEKIEQEEKLKETAKDENSSADEVVETQPQNDQEGQENETALDMEEKADVEITTDEVISPEEEAKRIKKAKTLKIVRWVCYGLVAAALVFLLAIVITLCVEKFQKKSPVPSVFGCSMLIVKTGSMSGTFEVGDVIVIKKQKEYKIGDIVTFLPENDVIPTTHRIVRIEDDKIYTKGDNNNAEDGEYITIDNIYGKVENVLPGLGLFVWWFRDELGWIYILGAIIIVATGIYILKYFLPKKSK